MLGKGHHIVDINVTFPIEICRNVFDFHGNALVKFARLMALYSKVRIVKETSAVCTLDTDRQIP